MVTFVGHSFLNSTILLISTISSFLYIHMYVAKRTIPCFLKGLENIHRVLLLFPFVFVILASYWKMAVLAERLISVFLSTG
jgi:hypothetical protein